MSGELINSLGLKKKLVLISAVVTLLSLTPMVVVWTSAVSADWGTLTIDVVGSFARKGVCMQTSSGMISADLPDTYTHDPEAKIIGGVTWDVLYKYTFDETSLPLELVEDMNVHIHIETSFRKLKEGVPTDITMLMISGCTKAPETGEGVQYCLNAYFEGENIGTVTKDGNILTIVASILDSELCPASFCVNRWSEGTVVDGFCIPLHLNLAIDGTITT